MNWPGYSYPLLAQREVASARVCKPLTPLLPASPNCFARDRDRNKNPYRKIQTQRDYSACDAKGNTKILIVILNTNNTK